LGSIAPLRTLESPSDAGSVGYIAYLAGMVLVPAFLLITIGQARNWGRIALLILYGLNFLFRIFLFVNDGQFKVSLAAWILVPAIVQSIAFLLLFLPRSATWFGAGPDTSLNRARERRSLGDQLKR
jgi:cellulose synthase/poly-beta-1,6-N-acetylglucosamine synthase-like glycosyltransferase